MVKDPQKQTDSTTDMTIQDVASVEELLGQDDINVPYLVVLAGDMPGRVIRLDPGKQYAAGRSRNCDIVLDDQNTSRIHAFFDTDEQGQTVLRDHGSTNGSLVNGKKMDTAILEDGDRICLGNVILRYSLKDDLEFIFQQELFEKATRDQLTGAYNKAFFLDAFQKEFTFHQRSRKPLSLLIMDLDNFKKINDVYGHVNGDIVLKSIAKEIMSCLRKEDLFARYGGEEFTVLFRNTSNATALRVANKLLELVRSMKFSSKSAEFKTSVTIGVATLHSGNFQSIQSMIIRADRNLYMGKRKGKDCAVG